MLADARRNRGGESGRLREHVVLQSAQKYIIRWAPVHQSSIEGADRAKERGGHVRSTS